MVNQGVRGIHSTILAGVESTWGSAVSATKSLGLVTEFTQNDKQTTRDHHGLGQANAIGASAGVYKPEGSISLEMCHGRMLEYAIFGGATTSTDCSTDCTHVFSVGNDLPSYTVEESFNETTDIQNLWAGVVFNTTNLDLTVDGILT